MLKTETLAKVKAAIAQVCEVDLTTVGDAGKLAGYGIDSVRLVDLVLAIEESCGVRITETDPALARIQTVRELAEYVDRQR